MGMRYIQDGFSANSFIAVWIIPTCGAFTVSDGNLITLLDQISNAFGCMFYSDFLLRKRSSERPVSQSEQQLVFFMISISFLL